MKLCVLTKHMISNILLLANTYNFYYVHIYYSYLIYYLNELVYIGRESPKYMYNKNVQN